MPHSSKPPELYTPKIITVWREGYRWRDLRADAVAGLTVAVVALPLSMGIAIASGVSPERGLATAIVGGFFISLLGGSRFQIGGPAGAFIGLIAGIVERHGYDGLALATLMAGVMMIAAAALRVGGYIRLIPHAVIVGFTAGIAVIIAASQISEVLGLKLGHEPVALLPKLAFLHAALPTVNYSTVGIALVTLSLILAIRMARPTWPAFLIGITVATLAAAVLHADVATVFSRFGAMPRTLPFPAFPEITLAKVIAMFPDAVAIALLGAIESLLSALVADKMSGARHRSNGELGAQGVGNIAATAFGGICVTGTIARTATNVRAGSRGPISGILHSIYLLLFLALAAPLVGLIPLAALAAMLIVVSWTMTEKAELVAILRARNAETVILAATFLLTIFVNLLTGIAAGVAIALVLHVYRRARPA
ncbi:MAG: SulP family inorganic anion transporter [Pseudolabrys sp.]|nr:SulP family inorganic anion transporter [Pseudolabrys sp.]